MNMADLKDIINIEGEAKKYLNDLNNETMKSKGLDIIGTLGISDLDSLAVQQIIEAFDNLHNEVIDLRLDIAEKLKNHVTDSNKVEECRQKEDVLFAIYEHPYLSKLWIAYKNYTRNAQKQNNSGESYERHFGPH